MHRDPDLDSRKKGDNITIGPVLGSVQDCALEAHTHTVSSFPGPPTLSEQRFHDAVYDGWVNVDGVVTEPRGEGDTHPRNTVMNFIIKFKTEASQ